MFCVLHKLILKSNAVHILRVLNICPACQMVFDIKYFKIPSSHLMKLEFCSFRDTFQKVSLSSVFSADPSSTLTRLNRDISYFSEKVQSNHLVIPMWWL